MIQFKISALVDAELVIYGGLSRGVKTQIITEISHKHNTHDST